MLQGCGANAFAAIVTHRVRCVLRLTPSSSQLRPYKFGTRTTSEGSVFDRLQRPRVEDVAGVGQPSPSPRRIAAAAPAPSPGSGRGSAPAATAQV